MSARDQFPLLYLSAPHQCPYIESEVATTLVIDPDFVVGNQFYSVLVTKGFRRSGDTVYRPHCQSCSRCVSVRLPVEHFRASRSQKRCWRNNQDLRISKAPLRFRDDHFDLYMRYQSQRHPDSSMNDPNKHKYIDFILTADVSSALYEVHLEDQLVAVSLTDELYDGFSAVYTFYEPTLAGRGLGTFFILWQIEEVRRLGQKWLYLGYWIRDCKKMDYKTKFQPIQGFVDGRWIWLNEYL